MSYPCRFESYPYDQFIVCVDSSNLGGHSVVKRRNVGSIPTRHKLFNNG